MGKGHGVLSMPKHAGKFKWKKYSKYSGNLKGYWVDPTREPAHDYPPLKKEYGALDFDMGGCLYDEGEEIKLCPGEKLYYRYITDWIEVK